jgi:hypothetical protein
MLKTIVCMVFWAVVIWAALKWKELDYILQIKYKNTHSLKAFFLKIVIVFIFILLISLMGEITEWIIRSMFQPLIDLL